MPPHSPQARAKRLRSPVAKERVFQLESSESEYAEVLQAERDIVAEEEQLEAAIAASLEQSAIDQERLERQRLREEQEQEYQAALAADRAKRAEEERQRQLEEERLARAQKLLARLDEESNYVISLVLPSGKRYQLRMPEDTPLEILPVFCERFNLDKLTFWTDYPRTQHTDWSVAIATVIPSQSLVRALQ